VGSADIIERTVAALEAGEIVVLPTDTVYGLAAAAFGAEPARRLYRLKGRDEIQPTALMASSVDVLLEWMPELSGQPAAIVWALLPGPFTLIVPNPARRYCWLSGIRPETIGVRVPVLSGAVAEVVDRLGAIVATSANLPGGPDPRRLDEVPAAIRAGVVAALDGGELPGTPSTVIDLTGRKAVILRAGAGDPEEALARCAAAHT
jgi:L-threonylcarbamoyladenylate synthase